MKKIFIILTCFLLSIFAQSSTTPLIQAVLKQDIPQVESLLKKGVDKNAKDAKGYDALDYALSRKLPYIAQILYTNDPNKFIFLRPNAKPLHVEFNKNGFTVDNPKINKKALVFGTMIADSFKEVCQSFDRAVKKNITLSSKDFQIIFVLSDKNSFNKIKNLNQECKKFTIFTYPNYKFYKYLAKLFQYAGTPQILFRDKSGKVVGGTIETFFFEKSKSFSKILE